MPTAKKPRVPRTKNSRPATTSTQRRSKETEASRPISKASFVSLLRRVADALESERTVSVSVKGHRLRLPRGIGFSVEYEHSEGEHELELQVSWRQP